MRILRVRRGFTTNSSASSEWLPPDGETPETNPPLGPESGPARPFTPTTKIAYPMQHQALLSNLTRGGGLVAVVACAFVADRLWRAFRKRRSPAVLEHEDHDEFD